MPWFRATPTSAYIMSITKGPVFYIVFLYGKVFKTPTTMAGIGYRSKSARCAWFFYGIVIESFFADVSLGEHISPHFIQA